MGSMLMWRVAVVVTILVGCTKHNPIQCDDGHDCEDPNKPFCDIDGVVDGESSTCIPGACTPGATLACAGTTKYVCNQLGSSYTQEMCVLGCSGETRCKDIDPSNAFATILDKAPLGPDVVLTDGDSLNIETGTVQNAGTTRLVIPITNVPAPTFGVPIAVFAVHSLSVTGTIRILTIAKSTAVAFVSSGPIDIDGVVVVTTGGFDGANQVCRGSDGTSDGSTNLGGGGGAGNNTSGANGGGEFSHASGGSQAPNDALEPLRGGCSGGAGLMSGPGHGGGALQLTSSTSVVVGANGRILANGGIAGGSVNGSGSGGSSGGGILLEAPMVTLISGAVLSANGSGGAAGDGTPSSAPMDGSPSKGGVCTDPLAICSNGGDGNNGDGPPTPGSDDAHQGLADLSSHFGGGGGAGGHIRINTLEGKPFAHPGVTVSPTEIVGAIILR